MADDKHYIPGSYYQICDRTGFKVRNFNTQREWDGLQVRDASWEPRQPQDFVRGVRDYQNVPIPRPQQIPVFIGPLTTLLTAGVAAGGNILNVQSTVRMFMGDNILVMLDNMQNFKTMIVNVIDLNSMEIFPVLPWSASTGNILTDMDAVASPGVP
jgi:hypothetical protein